MKIAIVGFDVEGRSSYNFFASQGHELTICDQNPDTEIPNGADCVLGDSYLDNLDRFDLVVRTAGLNPQKILAKNPGIEAKISTHINEFLKACPTENVIGVTGTKGKGTTSSLITKMLAAAGHEVRLGGNIGIPPLNFIDELTPKSWVVLELSSFQLIDLQRSPHIAVCLMVVPEHLNWHADVEEYMDAKAQLFHHQGPDDTAVYYENNANSRRIAFAGPGHKIPYYAAPGAYIDSNAIVIDGQRICNTDEIKLLGKHNWQNACAAVTVVWQVIQDVAAIRSVLTSFSGLEHRLEYVAEINGVRYYDDSFGTAPETAMVAIQAFEEPKVIILGGSDKGVDFGELAQTVARGNVRHAVIIGETGPKITAALDATGFHDYSNGGTTMTQMLDTCQAHAQPGDIVLLSTACASFDLFHDYKDRGNQFKAEVVARLVG